MEEPLDATPLLLFQDLEFWLPSLKGRHDERPRPAIALKIEVRGCAVQMC